MSSETMESVQPVIAEELEQYVPRVHFELIPIKNLVSNQQYQRNLSFSHVERAAQNFDMYQVNPVKVSRRDGVNYVFNGQHTIEIIALISGSRETPVWCMIYDDLDYVHEADVFANQMKYVKPLLPYEIFMANIEAGNNEQIIIKELVESLGLSITASKKPGSICAIATLERIYEQHGYHMLERILRLAIATWDGDPNALSGNMLMGIMRILVAFGTQIDDTLFRDRVGRSSVREIIRSANDRHSGSLGFAETMLMVYNRKTKFQLDIGALYTKKPVGRKAPTNDDTENDPEEDAAEEWEDAEEEQQEEEADFDGQLKFGSEGA